MSNNKHISADRYYVVTTEEIGFNGSIHTRCFSGPYDSYEEAKKFCTAHKRCYSREFVIEKRMILESN